MTDIKPDDLRKPYVAAEAEIVIVDSADIICTSPGGSFGENPGWGGWDDAD